MADALREDQITNPQLRLDDGQLVWGCECWWGPEAQIRQQVAQYPEQVTITLTALRGRGQE